MTRYQLGYWLGTLVLCLLAVTPMQAQRQALDEGRRYTQEALEAYKAKDYDAYVVNLQKALEYRPNHPALVYRLAGAYALAGQPENAIAWLGQYAAMGLTARAAEDEDLASVQDLPGFAEAVNRMAQNTEPVGESEEAFRLSDPTFVPENVAYDPVTKTYFVSSVHQRRIVRVGHMRQEEDFATAEKDSLWSVLGIALDADRRRLWAGSAAIKQTRNLPADDLGRSGLWLFDLDSGEHLRTFLLPQDDQEHVLGDLTVAPNGDVYASDALTGAVYTVREGSTQLTVFLEPQTLSSPQGQCFMDDTHLMVADYALGLLKIDPATRSITVLPPPQEVTLLGIDGLACYRDRLIAVQNGVAPQRILQFRLNETRDRIVATEVLAANHPLFQEPTSGTIIGDTYIYVANSQWNRFDAEGQLPDATELAPPLLLKIDLQEK